MRTCGWPHERCGALPTWLRHKRIGCGDETRTRIISFTRRALCYPIELRRNLVDWEGVKPSQEVCRTSMLSLHHQHKSFGGCGWSRTTNLALMRLLLYFRFS